MRVCYFGMYDPEYARNRILIKGLRQNGVEVIVCCDRSPSLMKYWRLFRKHLRIRNNYDVMVVGFPGQGVMPLAWLIASRPIVFDAFLSLYEMNIIDRAVYSPRGFHAFYYWFLDWFSCWLAETILLDTYAHINYFFETFGVSRKKCRRVLVGAEVENNKPSIEIRRHLDLRNPKNFVVHWHGSYIPLQGVAYIMQAIDLVQDTNIQWEIIGRENPAPRNKRVIFSGPMPFSELMELVKKSDVCLGIFGATEKTKRVIPNKVYECLSAGKPVITADTPAIREVFNDQELCLIPSADPIALARAIVLLKQDAGVRQTIARNGHKKLLERATPLVLGMELKNILVSSIQ